MTGFTNYAHSLMVKCFNEEYDKHLEKNMTGYQSKKAAALDEDGMYLVHHTQPAQEPVAWMYQCSDEFGWRDEIQFVQPPNHPVFRNVVALYTAPPQRPWVDLTDSQIEQVYYDLVKIHRGAPMPWGQINFGKTLQALIKEKNT